MSDEITIEVEVEADAWLDALPGVVGLVDRAARAALSAANGPPDADVTVLLTDDAEVRQLNGQFRGKDTATNVLSFPAAESFRPHLGDIALALETCAAEARAQDKTLEAHLSHLVAHGTLHLLGWDHQTDSEAEAMEALERTVLATLGFADPYAHQDETDVERRRSE